MAAEVNLELLLGHQVKALNGHSIGRIEEMIAERKGRRFRIFEYHVGRYALLERLSANSVAQAILTLFRLRQEYRITWDKLDIGDSQNPRITCAVAELDHTEP